MYFDTLLLGAYVCVKGFYVLLENWPFYYYVVFLFIPDNFTCYEVCCVWELLLLFFLSEQIFSIQVLQYY